MKAGRGSEPCRGLETAGAGALCLDTPGGWRAALGSLGV